MPATTPDVLANKIPLRPPFGELWLNNAPVPVLDPTERTCGRRRGADADVIPRVGVVNIG